MPSVSLLRHACHYGMDQPMPVSADYDVIDYASGKRWLRNDDAPGGMLSQRSHRGLALT